MTEIEDVYQLFHDRLASICCFHLAIDANGKFFTSIEIKDQLPNEDICGALARHMCEALTTHGPPDKQ